MVGPDFTTPPAPIADAWLEANDPALKAQAPVSQHWWTVFNDPTLNHLVETAYQQNLSLLSAGTRVLQARAELGVAIGELYPQT